MPVFRKSRRVTPSTFWKFPWPTAFSSGLRYIASAFRRVSDAPTIRLWTKKSSPAQRPTVRGGQRQQREHFDELIERGRRLAMTQNGCISTTDNRNAAPARQAVRVNRPKSNSMPDRQDNIGHHPIDRVDRGPRLRQRRPAALFVDRASWPGQSSIVGFQLLELGQPAAGFAGQARSAWRRSAAAGTARRRRRGRLALVSLRRHWWTWLTRSSLLATDPGAQIVPDSRRQIAWPCCCCCSSRP